MITNSEEALLDTSVTGTIPRAALSSCFSSGKLKSFPQQDPIIGVVLNSFCEPQLFCLSYWLYIDLSIRTGNKVELRQLNVAIVVKP